MEKSRIRQFSEGEVIIKEDEVHSEMFKVLQGHAICYFHYGKDDEYIIGAIGENQCFGEFGLLTGSPELYTVIAHDDVAVLAIDKDEFDNFLIFNHINARDIMKNLARTCSVMKTNINLLTEELNNVCERDKNLISQIQGKLKHYNMDFS